MTMKSFGEGDEERRELEPVNESVKLRTGGRGGRRILSTGMLRPQTIGGFTVVPILDAKADESRTRLTVSVQVGGGADGELRTVRSEDLRIAALDSSGDEISVLERPAAEQLPTQGSRALYAAAVFTLDSAEIGQLRIGLLDSEATFAAQDVLPSLSTRDRLDPFATPPNPTDHYPVRPPDQGVPKTIFRAILDFLRGIGHFFKGIFGQDKECCAISFNAPATSAANPATPLTKSHTFTMNAVFRSSGDCQCDCCEYRQFVRGWFRDAAGANIPHPMPDGVMDATDYREDCRIDEFGPGRHGCYGHRATSIPGDTYMNPGPTDGCRYEGRDTPRCSATGSAHLEFIGLIVDLCQGRITEVRTWVVNL